MSKKSSAQRDFDKIVKIIAADIEVHKAKTREFCVKSSVIPGSNYYNALQKEYQEIENTTTPQKTKPSLEEYTDLFKAFDEYPSNLQKPKKLVKANSSSKSGKSNSSTSSSINSSKTLDDQPSAAAIYNEFLSYTQKLAEFKEELRKQTTSREYAEELEAINTFARELDKILSSEDVSEEAFTTEEEIKLKKIAEHMEDFVYIQENRDLYGTVEDNPDNSARLNDLVNIVTDALVAINCFKSS